MGAGALQTAAAATYYPGVRVLLFSAVFATLIGSGCASAPPIEPPSDVHGLTFETYPGPFCGRCDATKITVANDGRVWIEQGHWRGDYRDWRVTRREEHVSPEGLSAFRARLDEYRPQGELILDDLACQTFETDNSGINIVWRDERGEDRLAYNFGCDWEAHRTMAGVLKSAPALLGIADLRLRELEW